jgi:hypothetical protein
MKGSVLWNGVPSSDPRTKLVVGTQWPESVTHASVVTGLTLGLAPFPTLEAVASSTDAFRIVRSTNVPFPSLPLLQRRKRRNGYSFGLNILRRQITGLSSLRGKSRTTPLVLTRVPLEATGDGTVGLAALGVSEIRTASIARGSHCTTSRGQHEQACNKDQSMAQWDASGDTKSIPHQESASFHATAHSASPERQVPWGFVREPPTAT